MNFYDDSTSKDISTDQWETLIRHSTDIITVLDADGIIQFQSPAVRPILGYGQTELIGENAFNYIHPSDVDHATSVFAALVESPAGTRKSVEFRFRRADDSWVWLETVGSNRMDSALSGFVLNSRDISERKRYEQQLEESQRLLTDVLDNVESAVWMRDIQSRFLLVNNEFRNLFDISNDVPVVGKNSVDLLGEELGQQFRSNDNLAYQAGETVELQEPVPIEGKTRHYLTQITPLYDSNGQPYGTCGIASDITEQKEIESALRERNKELEALHFTAALFATRAKPLESLFEELVHKSPEWFQYPERTEVCVSFNGIMVESAGFDPENVKITSETDTPDEQTITIDIGYSAGNREIPFLDEERQLIETVATFLGVAIGRRLQEEQLVLFKRAVEEAGHAVMITNENGTVEYVNPAFEVQSGYTRAEAVGCTPRILKSGKHDQAFYEELWETILCGQEWAAELVNRRKNGSLYFVDQRISPIRNAESEITHFVAIESEITQRRVREQQLEVLNRVLRHNLRNSLNVIDGHASLIGDKIEQPRLMSSVETVQMQVDRLVSISEKTARIRDLFNTDDDLTSVCDLTDLLRELEADLQDQYPGVNLNFDYPPTANVRGDHWLKLALKEATENAIIHNDHAQPSVSIAVEHTDNSHPRGGLDVTVSDNGPGIPESERSVIEAGTETSLQHGSSIGLWVIIWIVSRFGGEVNIENNTPRGTRLMLHLPGPADGN